MGLKGPMPATAAEQIAKGQRRPSRVNYKEPEVECATDRTPPKDLVRDGLAEWTRLIDFVCDNGYVSNGDTQAFADYCRVFSRKRDLEVLEEQVKEQSPTEWLKLIPSIIKAQDQTMRLRAQCGLSPASRAQVRAAKGAISAKKASTSAKYLAFVKKEA